MTIACMGLSTKQIGKNIIIPVISVSRFSKFRNLIK